MADLIHEGHQGIKKFYCTPENLSFGQKFLMKSIKMVDKYGICKTTSTTQRKLPSVPSEIPQHAWHTLGTDFFYWKHIDFLVLGDYFFKYLIVRKLPS